VKETAQIWKKLPNTFSPNADGVNDLFFIEDNNVSDFSITIIDSKNNIVYKSDEVNFKWDGRDFSGNLVEAGTYIYYVMGSDHSNKKIAKTSYLTIIR
jgi:gliding motility-associated-like protein